ncbi:unnamed protein product [Gulo gulo]|uniref:Uncharacterized protein n=1 Tax=Gulo gulo TaxID=48420 RepID=A0A9X9LHK0_GULGU|nr:unnamed protein product [Gulo gulo]
MLVNGAVYEWTRCTGQWKTEEPPAREDRHPPASAPCGVLPGLPLACTSGGLGPPAWTTSTVWKLISAISPVSSMTKVLPLSLCLDSDIQYCLPCNSSHPLHLLTAFPENTSLNRGEAGMCSHHCDSLYTIAI